MLVDKPQQTTGPNTTMPSYSLRPTHPNTTHTIQLIQCIISQNDSLKHQIGHIQTQLEKAQHLSTGLLKQNESLRSLYRQRTKDINKLVKTMSIECDEGQINGQHQCHLLQQLNYATLKQIKRLDKQIKDKINRINDQKASIDRINALRNQVDHDSLNKIRARINNGVSHQSIAKKKKLVEEAVRNNNELERQINNLIVDNSALVRDIEQLNRSQQPQRHEITQQKVEYQARMMVLLEQNKRYSEELNADKAQYQNTLNEYQLKQQNSKKNYQLLTSQIQKYEKAYHQYNDSNAQKENVQNKIRASIQRQEVKNNQLNELKYAKAQIIKNIEVVKKRIKNVGDNVRKEEDTMRNQTRQNISKLTKQMTNSQSANEKERKKVRKQIEADQNRIVSQQFEVHLLEDQIEEYNNLIREHPNPICQIQRIQLMMRLKQKK